MEMREFSLMQLLATIPKNNLLLIASLTPFFVPGEVEEGGYIFMVPSISWRCSIRWVRAPWLGQLEESDLHMHLPVKWPKCPPLGKLLHAGISWLTTTSSNCPWNWQSHCASSESVLHHHLLHSQGDPIWRTDMVWWGLKYVQFSGHIPCQHFPLRVTQEQLSLKISSGICCTSLQAKQTGKSSST